MFSSLIVVSGVFLTCPGQHQAQPQQLVELGFKSVDDGLRFGAQLFVGDQADSDRVKEALTVAGATYRFAETK